MAIDTFIAYVGIYSNPADADADYQLVKELHTKEGLIDSYDAAVLSPAPGHCCVELRAADTAR